jgi:DNA invertase Pin-like site-specific DNA recombinase
MSTSTLITPTHLTLKAIVYIRQSTPHQALSNQESLRLQYALKQRALDWGWSNDNIQIIDSDLGLTGTSAQLREGFKELVALVTLGQVGIILSSDVTRLARNCSDWYPLLDLCSYRRCLIADRDAVYDPATPNGRLLLGIKGQLSELELQTIRARMTAGLLNKAKRGELRLRLPTGLIHNESDQVVKIPNREVQQRIELIFDTFLRLKSACQVVCYFNEQCLHIPRRDRFGDIIWKKAAHTAVLGILKNPAYAGAFVYGRTQTTRDATGKAAQKSLPMSEWRICVKDKYPAYISWETYEKIQAMLKDNYAEYACFQSRGIPREGKALLPGLVYCGECGHKMSVRYKDGVQYLCESRRQKHQLPMCQCLRGEPIDAQVVTAFFQVLSPAELDVYTRMLAAHQETEAKIDQAQQQQLERLRYQAALAERQFNRVDPDNRLVAAELEKRWEEALLELKLADETIALEREKRQPALTVLPALREAFTALGRQLPQIWKQDLLTNKQKKALLRCLVDKVVVHRSAPDCVHTRIVWRGGATTTYDIPVAVKALADLTNVKEMEAIILRLSRGGQSDAEIATYLSSQGFRSPTCPDKVLPRTVQNIRLKHRIFRSQYSPRSQCIPGYLTLPQLAQALEVKPHWLYYQIKKGSIQIEKDAETGLYLFPDTPDTLKVLRRFQVGECKHLCFRPATDVNTSPENVGYLFQVK